MVTILNSNKYGALTEAKLVEFEQQIGYTLPSDYREFLLTHNGGIPDHTRVFISDSEETILVGFLGIHDGKRYARLDGCDLIQREWSPETLLVIADDPFGNMFCISLAGESNGIIYFQDYEIFDNNDTGLIKLADNFTDFLNGLLKEPERAYGSALEKAALTGDLETLRRFPFSISKAITRTYYLESKDKYNRTLLQNATIAGHLEVVKFLREQGAALPEGTLMLAAQNGHHMLVEYLLAQGIAVDEISELNGNLRLDTALMTASALGHLEVVKVLIAHGANVNAQNKFEQSAIVHASWGEHREIIDLLREHGAEWNRWSNYR